MKKIVDPAQFGKVAVLMGGDSAERAVSLQSGSLALEALKSKQVDAHGIDIGPDILDRLRKEQFDRAFIALHAGIGEDGTLQAGLEMIGLPYTGSGVLACAVSMTKLVSKRLWRGAGLPTPDFAILPPDFVPEEMVAQLGLPLFVKPDSLGSSVGVSRVDDVKDLRAAYEEAVRYDRCVLAEKGIDGGEYTIGILGEKPLPVIRIETPRPFYDYVAKYEEHTTQYHCPSGLTLEEEQATQSLAKQAFDVMGGSGWGRVDMMRDAQGQNWVIDINTVPGLSSTSLVPKAAAATGIDFPQMIWQVLETSFCERGTQSHTSEEVCAHASQKATL